MATGFKIGNPGCGCECNRCSSSHTLTVTVTDYSGSPVSLVAVSISGPGGFSASGTTDGNGQFVANWTTTGDYTITVSKSGQSTSSTTVTLATCANQTATVCIGCAGTSQSFKLVGNITGACGNTGTTPITVTATVGGNTFTTTTTTRSYAFCLPWTPGATVTIAAAAISRYSAYSATVGTCGTGTGQILACSTKTASITYQPASGYVCWPNWATPVPRTLSFSAAYLGSCSLTYNSSVSTAGGYIGPAFVGTLVANLTGCTTYTGSANGNQKCPDASGVVITVYLIAGPAGGSIELDMQQEYCSAPNSTFGNWTCWGDPIPDPTPAPWTCGASQNFIQPTATRIGFTVMNNTTTGVQTGAYLTPLFAPLQDQACFDVGGTGQVSE